jgi:hypothetical protein
MSVLVVCRHRLFDERTLSLTTSGDWDRDPESGAAEDFDMADGYEGPGEGRSSPERERHLLRGQHRGVWSRWVLAAILQCHSDSPNQRAAARNIGGAEGRMFYVSGNGDALKTV